MSKKGEEETGRMQQMGYGDPLDESKDRGSRVNVKTGENALYLYLEDEEAQKRKGIGNLIKGWTNWQSGDPSKRYGWSRSNGKAQGQKRRRGNGVVRGKENGARGSNGRIFLWKPRRGIERRKRMEKKESPGLPKQAVPDKH